MPTSTARYRFEFRIHEWAMETSRRLFGEEVAFFVGFREDGTVRRIYCASPGSTFDGTRKAALAEAHVRWFLFAPYKEPQTAYVEWLGLDLSTMERWLDRRLKPADYLDVRTTGTRDAWPESWRVIIA